MTRLIALLLCLLFPVAAFAAENDYKVTYDGGSVQNLKTGPTAHLIIEPKQILVVQGKDTIATIPADSITEIS